MNKTDWYSDKFEILRLEKKNVKRALNVFMNHIYKYI